MQSPSSTLLIEERYLLSLLGAFLRGAKPNAFPPELSLSRLLTLSREQRVAPIVAYLALQSPDVFPSEIASSLMSELYASIEDEARQTRAFSQLNQAFRESNVNYMPLKGFLMREYYPEPYLRSMTDYDVLIKPEDIERARDALNKQGFRLVKISEHHDVYAKGKNLLVEQHNFLFKATWAFRRRCGISWKRLVPYESTEYRFTPEDFYRFMVEHFLKHWFYNQTSLRDYLDVAFYLRAKGDALNRAKLDADFASIGVLDFTRNLERLVDAWFHERELDDALMEMTLYQFRRHELNRDAISAGNNPGLLANYFAAGSDGDARAKTAKIKYLLTTLSLRINAGFARLRRNVPVWKIPFVVPAIFLKFWLTRLFRKSFYRNFRAFLSASPERTNAATQFQRRVGLDANHFRSADWLEDED